jgi:hypothetical protein
LARSLAMKSLVKWALWVPVFVDGWCWMVVLDAAVLELYERRVPWAEEVGVVVRRRQGLASADIKTTRGAAPCYEEVAGGVAVGDGVVGREPDGERPAGKPRELHLHHLLELAVQVRVQLQDLRRGLVRRDVGEGGVHACLHEPRAMVVEQDTRRAVRASTNLAGEEAIHGQYVGEAALDVGRGGRRRRECVDDGHLDVVRELVEHGGRHALRRVLRRCAVGVQRLHQLRAHCLNLHGVQFAKEDR